VLRRDLLDHDYVELPIISAHAVILDSLPPLHKDPFDRLLLAQALSENVTLLTARPLPRARAQSVGDRGAARGAAWTARAAQRWTRALAGKAVEEAAGAEVVGEAGVDDVFGADGARRRVLLGVEHTLHGGWLGVEVGLVERAVVVDGGAE
jgi:hypothetical protein